jgi:hypothetical protein
MTAFVIPVLAVWSGMNEEHLLSRLAELQGSSQPDYEKCTQAFLIVSTFLHSSHNIVVDRSFKVQLRGMVDEFYRRAVAALAAGPGGK